MVVAHEGVHALELGGFGLLGGESSRVATVLRGTHRVHPPIAGRPRVGALYDDPALAGADVALVARFF